MSSEYEPKLSYLISFAVIAIGVTGYFVGLSSPMNPSNSDGNRGPESGLAKNSHLKPHSNKSHQNSASSPSDFVDAKNYGQMRSTDRGAGRQPVSLTKKEAIGHPEITVTLKQKEFALARREQNRAFNGAPPTVPHPIHQTSAKSCLACHQSGASSETLRIPQMSHKFFANCTQCHVESNPQHAQPIEFRKNSFVGLAAPKSGPRAFSSAPPQIPHTTWMRSNCLSCHGKAGSHGMKTTHPWRTNCTQCHAPSSKLDQQLIDAPNTFLPKIKIENGGKK